MPRQPKKPQSDSEWKPDFDRILSFKNGVLLIGGIPQDADMVMTLKNEASNLKHFVLLELLANTIANEASRFALEEAKVGESDNVRSNKLAFAQALSMWNKHVWTNIELLRKK